MSHVWVSDRGGETQYNPAMAATQKLPTASSLWLDVIRFGSAIAIVIVHLAQSFFSTGWPDLVNGVGLGAVAVFFILSGFVIRYVTRLKYTSISEYWVDRSSRIYSVVLPAILFTIIADLISSHVNPGYYIHNWGYAWNHPIFRLLANLTFLSQIWSRDIALFSNGPFWTLSYECLYYVLYGVFFYLTGWKQIIWVLVISAILGPHMLMLVPLWTLGCVVHELYQRLRVSSVSFLKLYLLFAGIAIATTVFWMPIVSLIYYLKRYETFFFWHIHHKPLDLGWITWYYRVGFPFAFLLLWSLLWTDRIRLESRSKIVKFLRFMSEGTFALYLFHFPAMVLIASLISYDHGSALEKIGILIAVVAFGISLATPTNHFKNWLRDWMRRRFIPMDAMPDARPVEMV
jgi:peptidoglycan/LPS O-acetylase OafA/YrhL